MIDKFLKATGLKNEKEFLKRYPTEDSFFNEYPEYMQYQKGGKVKKAESFEQMYNRTNKAYPPINDTLTNDELNYLGHKFRGIYSAGYAPSNYLTDDYEDSRRVSQNLSPEQVSQVNRYMENTDMGTDMWQAMPNFISNHRPDNSRIKQYGGYTPQTRRQGNIQITEDTPMDTFVQNTPPIDPYNQMDPLMNPYAPVYNQASLPPTNYQPYNTAQYDGIISDNYVRKEFNPSTGGWDNMGQALNVQLQPQYTGDWSNAQRQGFDASQPTEIGGYKTIKGKRRRKFGRSNIDYDIYKFGGQYEAGVEYDLTPEEIDSLKKLGYDFENL